MSKFKRMHLVVLDSVGIGAAPDAITLSMQVYLMVHLIHLDTSQKQLV